MTSGHEPLDPFLIRPDRSTTSGKPIDAPPPGGQRFAGPPPVSSYAPSPGSVDPSTYALNAPTGYSVQAFSRTWKVTFRRWGRGWLVFLALGTPCGIILGLMYPDPHEIEENLYSTASFLGTLWGVGVAYLLFFGWWLDHILANSGFKASLTVQAFLAGAIGLIGGLDAEARGDLIGFPPVYLFLFGTLGVILAHLAGKKVEGSFDPADDPSYSPPSV